MIHQKDFQELNQSGKSALTALKIWPMCGHVRFMTVRFIRTGWDTGQRVQRQAKQSNFIVMNAPGRTWQSEESARSKNALYGDIKQAKRTKVNNVSTRYIHIKKLIVMERFLRNKRCYE